MFNVECEIQFSKLNSKFNIQNSTLGHKLLRIEYLDEYAGPSGGVGLSHDVLDVLFGFYPISTDT